MSKMPKHPPKKFRKTGIKRPQQKQTDSSTTHHPTQVKQTDKQQNNTGSQSYNNPTQQAILDTLRYRQIFGSPMTLFQLWAYLLIDKGTNITSEKTGVKQFIKELNDLVAVGKVTRQNDFYALETIDHTEVEQRRKRTEKLLVQAHQSARYLKQIPWIEMVAVTGSVAAFNASEQSDIDILVVTKSNRLFLSRLFLVSTLKLLGVYWDAQKPAGTVCPNILLTSKNLTWDAKNQNLYTANEIALLYPLFFRHNCYFDFLKQNAWANKYLPNLAIVGAKAPAAKHQSLGKFVDLLEYAIMKIQISHMKNKKTTEVVSKNFMHFNTHDSGPTILEKFVQV